MKAEQRSPPKSRSNQYATALCGKETTSNNKSREYAEKQNDNQHVNVSGKKPPSHSRPKTLPESKASSDRADANEKVSFTNKHDTEDVLLNETLASALHDDEDEDLPQGAPLSIKNFFKAVRTFPKRVPKNPKPRDVPTGNTQKDTDIVVFERAATPRETRSSLGISRSLPPILDFKELVNDEPGRDENNMRRERLPRCKTDDKNWTVSSLGRVQRQSSPRVGIARLHSCSGLLPDFQSDALHEFGSLDFSAASRSIDKRKSRMSLALLYKQLDDHEALHF